jgi:protocatechuate 3,4-dioxygenase beta subunit
MDRRKFLTATTLAVFSISALGKVRLENGEFIGDCNTTNDILGPFYRPDAPTRQDLTHESLKGSIIELKGRVFKPDCVTPLSNALVEIWHCNTEGEYDNDSKEFHQRA